MLWTYFTYLLPPFEYGLFFYLVPLAAIPPAALSVIDELKSGHARLKLYRSSQKAYIAKRLVSISIGSMLPMLIGCLLFFAFSMLVGPLSGENGVSMRQASTTVLQPLATVQFGLPYIFFVMGQATLSAWLWGMIGALLALASLNKGTTLMNGFLLFWGCDCLCNYLHLSAWRPFTLFFYTTIIHGTVMGIVAKKYSAAWNCDVYGCRLDEPSLQKAVRRR